MHKFVTAVEVIDVEKRRLPSKHYVYVIKVTWDDARVVTIYRRYSNFFDLQTSLLETYPEEGGQLNPDERTIPFLPGKKYFGRSHIREVAEKRLGPINKYCKLLIKLDQKISRCHEVLTFFESTADDLCPKTNEKKPGETKISKPRLLEHYQAIFDYEKQSKDQVNLKIGQSVQVIEKYETGWWLVNTEYEEGYAPGTFLQKTDGQEEEQMFTCNGEKYICTQSYTAEGPDDHTLNIGAEVEVLQKSLDGWWWVRFNEKIGWAPATCLKPVNPIRRSSTKREAQANIPVEIVSNLSEVSKLLKGKTSASPLNSAMTESTAFSRPHSLGDTETESNYVSVYDESDGYEDDEESHYSYINSVYFNTPHTLPPPRQNTIERIPGQKTAEDKRTKFITSAQYVDSVGDGISFSEGQEVEVQQKTDSGWYYIKIDNEFGWAPSSYLKEIPMDETDMNDQEGKPDDDDDSVDGKEEEEKESDDDDDDDAPNMSPAKKLQNILASKHPPQNTPPKSLSEGSDFNKELTARLSSALGTRGTNSAPVPQALPCLSRKSAIKRPNSNPPAPPKRPDLPPLPTAKPNPQPAPMSPPPDPPPPPPPLCNPLATAAPKKLPVPPVSTGASKPSKKPSMSPPLVAPPPPPMGRPGKSQPAAAPDFNANHSRDSGNVDGNFSNELQSRLAKLKANLESSACTNNDRPLPVPKEKSAIAYGVHTGSSGNSPSENSQNAAKTKDLRTSRPLPPLPQSHKPINIPIAPSLPDNLANNNNLPSLSQKDDNHQKPSATLNTSNNSVHPSSSNFTEKLSVFQTNVNSDNTTPKCSVQNVPATANCRGLALLKRQKEKFKEEESDSKCKTSNENSQSDPKVSNLRQNFETCKIASNSGSALQANNAKEAPFTKVPLKPVHKVKPTTIPAKTNPDLPAKPKVSPCKPKLRGSTPTDKKDLKTNTVSKSNQFGGTNLALPAKALVSETQQGKPLWATEKVVSDSPVRNVQSVANEVTSSNIDCNLKNSEVDSLMKKQSSKTTDRSYKTCSIYIAESEDELSFQKGVDIGVIEKHESGWWLVQIEGEEGWAPSNHIVEVKPHLPSKPVPPNKPLPKLIATPSIKNTKTTNSIVSDTNSSQSENLSPSHSEKNLINENLKNNNKDVLNYLEENDNNCEAQFLVLTDFSAFEEGEVSIEEGMFLKVLDSSNIDWWHVQLPSGEEGWAPASCISSVHEV